MRGAPVAWDGCCSLLSQTGVLITLLSGGPALDLCLLTFSPGLLVPGKTPAGLSGTCTASIGFSLLKPFPRGSPIADTDSLHAYPHPHPDLHAFSLCPCGTRWLGAWFGPETGESFLWPWIVVMCLPCGVSIPLACVQATGGSS